MADARRFPRLYPPFAVAGAAAGWLSGGVLANARVDTLPREYRPMVVVCATIVAAVAGMVIRSWCVGRRYRYALDAPDPNARPPSDRTFRHVLAILATGALSGAAVWCMAPPYPRLQDVASSELRLSGAIGALCAVAFIPVGLGVIGAARRAQRARLGTLVAQSDRRAVWAILFTHLALTTLLAIPDWWRAEQDPLPVPAFCMAVVAGVVVVVVRQWDLRAMRHAEGVLREVEPVTAHAFENAPEIDLGLGEEVGAHLSRSVAAYRDLDRTLDVVRGDPELVRAALGRARRRGQISCALVFATILAHLTMAANRIAPRKTTGAMCTRTVEVTSLTRSSPSCNHSFGEVGTLTFPCRGDGAATLRFSYQEAPNAGQSDCETSCTASGTISID